MKVTNLRINTAICPMPGSTDALTGDVTVEGVDGRYVIPLTPETIQLILAAAERQVRATAQQGVNNIGVFFSNQRKEIK